jgi:hypothetical protein
MKDLITEDKPKRIQRKRTKGWRMPEGTLYVGRPTRWGNPYKPSDSSSMARHAAVEGYREWLINIMCYRPSLLELLRGKDLACFCPLDKPCHADVLLELAN